VVVLRCTKKLLARTGPAAEVVPPSTTRLGDWYANLLYTRQGQLILCAAERTLLPVLVPARDAKSLPQRLAHAAGQILAAIGVPPALIEAELKEMADVSIARTANRQVLGSMNDFAFVAGYDLDQGCCRSCPSASQKHHAARLGWRARSGRRSHSCGPRCIDWIGRPRNAPPSSCRNWARFRADQNCTKRIVGNAVVAVLAAHGPTDRNQRRATNSGRCG